MDSPRIHEAAALSPRSSARIRNGSDSNSPEFEFWMVRNPSFPQPNLLSADELFVDGVLLPLHLLSHHPPEPNPDPETPKTVQPGPESEAGPGPELTNVTVESGNGLTSSKRWTDIFKKGDKKAAAATKISEEKEKKREKKSQSGASSAAAELNINIWPFSRSRSAGNGGTRPRLASGAPGSRKVSSAPCSRSNSAGESKSRKWPSSPGRPGVHLGRSSPIWQVRRGGEKGIGKGEANETRSGRNTNKSVGNGTGTAGRSKVRVLNLNVPMCIGYRHHLGCRSDENSALGVVVGVGNNKPDNSTGTGNGNSNSNGSVTSSGNLFNLRSLFTKKVY